MPQGAGVFPAVLRVRLAALAFDVRGHTLSTETRSCPNDTQPREQQARCGATPRAEPGVTLLCRGAVTCLFAHLSVGGAVTSWKWGWDSPDTLQRPCDWDPPAEPLEGTSRLHSVRNSLVPL